MKRTFAVGNIIVTLGFLFWWYVEANPKLRYLLAFPVFLLTAVWCVIAMLFALSQDDSMLAPAVILLLPPALILQKIVEIGGVLLPAVALVEIALSVRDYRQQE